jgi:Ni,Fe-hydrogenase III component G
MVETALDQPVLDEVKEHLGDKIKNVFIHNPRRIYIDVDPEDWVETGLYLWRDRHARFAIATGLETLEGFEAIYHFAFDSDNFILSVRVKSKDKEAPSIPSMAGHVPAFDMIEREMHDLLGIDFSDHPALTPLVRSEDWPDDFYPLRRTNPGSDGKETKTT